VASKLSIKKTALDLMQLFAQRFGKEFVQLDTITSSQVLVPMGMVLKR
jgi:hypothetical protein